MLLQLIQLYCIQKSDLQRKEERTNTTHLECKAQGQKPLLSRKILSIHKGQK